MESTPAPYTHREPDEKRKRERGDIEGKGGPSP